jgi:hypothetical protein
MTEDTVFGVWLLARDQPAIARGKALEPATRDEVRAELLRFILDTKRRHFLADEAIREILLTVGKPRHRLAAHQGCAVRQHHIEECTSAVAQGRSHFFRPKPLARAAT